MIRRGPTHRRSNGRYAPADRTENDAVAISAPWWSHPTWVVLLLPLPLAIVAIAAGSAAYEQWEVPKYLTADLSVILLIAIAALIAGMVFGSARSMGIHGASFVVSSTQKHFFRVAYKVCFWLTVGGYAIWVISAIARGVGVSDLLEVVTLQPGAISGLKDNATPIGGVTTLTQFGPLAVAIGFLCRRMGEKVSGVSAIILLAALRALFYAERLAIIEVVVPLVLVWAFTLRTGKSTSLWAKILPLAPLLAAPALWALFATLEYTRSWIYYSQFTSLPYAEWVTNRLIGYYTTAYNNSALLASAATQVDIYPYFSVRFFWDAPIISTLINPPLIQGSSPGSWWSGVLQSLGNPNFNNYGSFLTSFAEFGVVGMGLLWLTVGVAIGSVYAYLKQGHPIALVTYCVLFVGILELPRFVYWTQGRAFPVILGCVILALAYSARMKREAAAHKRSSSARSNAATIKLET